MLTVFKRILLIVWCVIILCEVPAHAEGSAKAVRTMLIPDQETIISSQISGKILKTHDHIGNSFHKGDLLVQFDCDELKARLMIAEADRESAQINLNVKQELLALQSAGDVEVTLAKATLEKAKAQVALQTAEIKTCEIKAPFDGSVTKVTAHSFQSVTQGQPLMEIVSTNTPRVRMFVPSSWLVWLQVGSTFTIKIDETGKQYEGRVRSVSERIDAVSQTVEIEGTILKSSGLVAGMSGYASFSGRKAR